MKYISFFILLSITNTSVLAQNALIGVSDNVQDMGDLEDFNNIQSEFVITNNGTKNLYVLRADAGKGVKVRINKKVITPGDTSMLYVNIELENTGKLNEEIQLITSADAEPLLLKVKANIKSIKRDDKTACFYFNESNKKRKEGESVLIQFPMFLENSVDSSSMQQTEVMDTISQTDFPLGELDRNHYKPNNVIFLIDVSYSMKDSMNLPLAKEAMYPLINALRDIDTVSLITYSNNVQAIKEGIQGSEKTVLNNSISDLYAKGSTMGAKAILYSLDIAMKHYIEDGNNQLFLVTDGKFQFTDADFEKWKEKVGEKKVVLTIIALGNSEVALNQLQEMATKRGGSFISIQSVNDAEIKVLEEVKKQSLK